MLPYFYPILRVLVCFCVLSGCTALRVLSANKQTPAKGVVFKAPPAPYKKISKKDWDVLWLNTKNQNEIGFFSNCSADIAFTSAEQLEHELTGDLKNFQVIMRKAAAHQSQPARHLKLKGPGPSRQVIHIEFFVFKKQNCFYVINLIAPSPKARPQGEKAFQKFIQDFRAP